MALVPDVLAELIRSIVTSSPREIQWPVFAALFAAYVWVLIVLLARVWCWLDYQLATALRRARSAPLSLQYALGDVIASTPRLVGWGCLAFFLVTVGWDYVVFSVAPPVGTPLHWFQVQWRMLLRAVWG